MRTGVIVLASSVPEANLLAANLQEKGIPVLHCGQDDACNAPETITGFIAGNRLETVVVSNASGSSLPSPLRYAIESAGLGSHAVGWVDLVPLFGEELSQRNVRQASGAVLANVARLQRADYARNAVFRAVARSSKISRRELFRSFPRMLRMESDIPIVLADRCGDRSRSCSYCVKACPVKAVSAAPRAVVIDDRLCIECGACARDCPIGAIQSTSVSDNQMIAMLNTLAGEEVESEKRALLLTCGIGFERLLHEGRQGRHLDPGVVPVQVPCVSFIGSLHYLWAASVGVALATVCPDTSCKKSAAMFPLFHHTASSRNLVKATKGDKACSMRHFGLHANDSIVDIVSRAISPAATAGGARLAEGFRHEVTSEAIRALGADGD
ncbi:indolepyruvate ferredoxin oxidoreductase subunit alpha, partial [[Eubacterium] cellulosolvens]